MTMKKPRIIVRNLLKINVPINSADDCEITSKGPWRSSQTPRVNQALHDAYLKKVACMRYILNGLNF